MEGAEAPWTAVTRRDKAHRRTQRTKMARDYIMGNRAQNNGTSADSGDGSLHKSITSDYIQSASVTSIGVPGTLYAAPHACGSGSSIIESSLWSEAKPEPLLLPKANDTPVKAYSSDDINGSSKYTCTMSFSTRETNSSCRIDNSDDCKVDINMQSDSIASYFELGRTTLLHLMAKEDDICEQLKSAGLQGNFKVKVESNQCGFAIITQYDMTPEDRSQVISYIQKAKQEVLEKLCKLNYAGHGSDQFVVFQNGSEARHITSYHDDRGVLAFANTESSDYNLELLKSHGEVIFSEKIPVRITRDGKNSYNDHRNTRGSNVNKSRDKNLCGRVIFKTFDAAKLAAKKYDYSLPTSPLYVKLMHNSDQSRIDEGSTLTFTAKFSLPVQQIILHADHIPFADKLQSLCKAVDSPGTHICDYHCPWYWEFKDDIKVRVDVNELVEKYGWTESRVRSQVKRHVSQSTGICFSSEMVILKAGAPQKNNYIIGHTKNFVDSVVCDFVRTDACDVYISPLTTDQNLIIEAVFINPDDAKSVSIATLPDRLRNTAFTKVGPPDCRIFPYFYRKQVSSRIYQVVREGLDVLRDSAQQKFQSVVSIETAERKNGGAILFVKATSRDVGAKVVNVLNNILRPVELKFASDVLSNLKMLSTFSSKRWIKSLEQRFKVYIYVDEFRERISIYGPPEIKAHVKREIEEWLESKARKTTMINLHEQTSYWCNVVEIYRLQLESLTLDCGAEDVLFNFKKKSLMVVGDKSSVIKLRQILSSSSNDDRQAAVSRNECVACFCDISESFFRLSLCGHVYCLPCFYMYLFVSAEEGQFPLRCANCDDPILMEDVQWALRENYADLQWFINRSVSSMVTKHSDEYSHCSSPDCKLIYACKLEGGNTKFECPACGVIMCRSCHVPYHEGEACRSYRMKNGKYERAMIKWMIEDERSRGVCPRCMHGIEKEGGCNKLQCVVCEAHICWVCLKDFPNSSDAYKHLGEVHGGSI